MYKLGFNVKKGLGKPWQKKKEKKKNQYKLGAQGVNTYELMLTEWNG